MQRAGPPLLRGCNRTCPGCNPVCSGCSPTHLQVYLFFEAFPHLDTGPSFAGNRSLLAWGIALLAGLLGGLLVRCNSKKVLELVTAIVGGFGFAHAVHGLVAVGGGAMPGPCYLAVAIAIAVPGLWLQRRARLRSRQQPSRSSSRSPSPRRRPKRSRTSGIPEEHVHEEGL